MRSGLLIETPATPKFRRLNLTLDVEEINLECPLRQKRQRPIEWDEHDVTEGHTKNGSDAYGFEVCMKKGRFRESQEDRFIVRNEA
jgi:hypothetical protein